MMTEEKEQANDKLATKWKKPTLAGIQKIHNAMVDVHNLQVKDITKKMENLKNVLEALKNQAPAK